MSQGRFFKNYFPTIRKCMTALEQDRLPDDIIKQEAHGDQVVADDLDMELHRYLFNHRPDLNEKWIALLEAVGR